MSDKTILITGATSGIGLEAALYLHECGYRLFLVGRNEDKLREVSKQTGNSPYFVIDLENTVRIHEVADYCKENNILLDGMVHSAGIAYTTLLRYYDLEYSEKLMKINYFAFIELCKCLYTSKTIKNGGSIVAMSSLSSQMQGKGELIYSASKNALNSSVIICASEFLKRKIRVNALLPAFTETKMTETICSISDIAAYQPFGIIPPREIAYSIEFLLSDKSKYITGALIPISAGVVC